MSLVTSYFNASCEEEDTVMDDHTPFLEYGLRRWGRKENEGWRISARAVHVVASPFPAVWHTLEDDRQTLLLPGVS